MANDISLDQQFDIFMCFLKTKIEKVDWPPETHACVTNNGENLKYFNNTDIHAEKRIVVEYLENLPKDKEINNVKIVINYSPCVLCSNDINTFLSGRSDIKLEIVFAGLYYIKRKVPCPSGILQPFKPRKGIIYDSKENTGGLKKLIERQVALRTFWREDWTDLWSTLDKLSKVNSQTKRNIVPEDMIKKRLREDVCVKLELEIMLGKFESDNHVQDLMNFFKQGPSSDAGAEEVVDQFNRMTTKEATPDKGAESH